MADCWLLTALLLMCATAHAQVPHLIRYQGQVADSQGVPLEGPYTLTFRLYDAETAGAKVWEETQPSVPLTGGRFSVLLGQVTSLDGVDWSRSLWLSFQVGAEPELSPRQPITSVPLAIVAERLHGPITTVGSSVGIGTRSPTAALDVAGDLRFSGTLQGGTVPWSRISSFSGDPSPDTIADDGVITLGTETAGAYDSTADTIADDGIIALGSETSGSYDNTSDTIADDGRIALGSETSGSYVATINGTGGSVSMIGSGSAGVSTSGSTITVSTPSSLTCTTIARNYSGGIDVSCPAGSTVVTATCALGTTNIIHGQSPPPPSGAWNSWLTPNADAATGVHCESGGTTQLHLRCCKL